MSAELNKRVVRRLLEEVVNAGQTAIIDQLVSPYYYDNHPLPGTSADLQGLKLGFAIRSQAFPDFHVTIEQLVAEDDKVGLIMSGKGTHVGEFMGIEPTGKQFVIPEAHVFRLQDGKIVERWGITDLFGLMAQLGIVALPESSTVGG